MLTFYRTNSAFQFNVKKPTFKITEKGGKFIDDYGKIMVSAANGQNKVYDWSPEKKIGFAIGEGDLPILFKGLIEYHKTGKANIKLVHDPKAGSDQKGQTTSTFQIVNAPNEGTFFMNLTKTSAAGSLKVGVPIDAGHLKQLELLFQQNQNVILGLQD